MVGITTISVDVDVDIHDVIQNMSDKDKKELCEELIEDGYAPDSFEIEVFESIKSQSQTYTECELVELLKDMWDNKDFLNLNRINTLRQQLREERII